MAKSIYVGNLPFATTGEELALLFRNFGTVTRGEVITDRFSGRSRGFGLVEMPSDEEAERAIKALNGQPQRGRPMVVNEARPHAQPLPSNLLRGGQSNGTGKDGRGRRKASNSDADHHNRGED